MHLIDTGYSGLNRDDKLLMLVKGHSISTQRFSKSKTGRFDYIITNVFLSDVHNLRSSSMNYCPSTPD